MTAPTHIAFGVLLAAAAQSKYGQALACALGALLPDLDHPRSSIGRVLFFVSQPLNLIAGHRGIVHSFIVWLVPLVFGIFTHQPLVQWLAIGALSHCLIDCYSVSGVQALKPFTDRSVVIFKKDWRIKTGSVQEILLFLLLFAGVSGMNYAYAVGGPRKLINLLAKSPKITAEEFVRAGNRRCFARGEWRWANGQIEEVEWLVVGTERSYSGETGMVYWSGERLIRKQDGEFLRSTLVQSGQEWPLVKVQGTSRVQHDAFFLSENGWYFAKAGQLAFGTIKTVSGDYPEILSAEQAQNSDFEEWLTGGALQEGGIITTQ